MAKVSIMFNKTDLARIKARHEGRFNSANVMNILLQEAAINLVNPIKVAAHFSKGYSKSANLRGSIYVAPVNSTATSATVKVASSANYGIFVEKGTGVHGPKGVPYESRGMWPMIYKLNTGAWKASYMVKGQQPQPFFYNTISKQRGALTKAIKRRLLNK